MSSGSVLLAHEIVAIPLISNTYTLGAWKKPSITYWHFCGED